MYRVKVYFTDLQDGGRPYKVGDAFPRQGLEVSEKRIRELSTHDNKRGIPLIEEIKDTPKVKKEAPKEVEDGRSVASKDGKNESGDQKQHTRRVSGASDKGGKRTNSARRGKST